MRAAIAVSVFLSVASLACWEQPDFDGTCNDTEFICPDDDAKVTLWPDGCDCVGSPPTTMSDTDYDHEPQDCPDLEVIDPPGEINPDDPANQKSADTGPVSNWKTTQGSPMMGPHDAIKAKVDKEYISVDVPATLTPELNDLVVVSGQVQAKFATGKVHHSTDYELRNLFLETTANRDNNRLQITDIQRISDIPQPPNLQTRFNDPSKPIPYAYQLKWIADDPLDTRQAPLCHDPNDPTFRDWAVAVPGQWYKDGAYQPERRARITFACVDSPVGKCVERLAYIPYLEKGKISWGEQFAACVRAMRNDICGCGHSYTLIGTKIDAYNSDQLSSSASHPNPRPVMDDFHVYNFPNQTHNDFFNSSTLNKYYFEAAWDADGAMCLSKLRWGTAPADLGTSPSKECGPGGRLKNPRVTQTILTDLTEDEIYSKGSAICDLMVRDGAPATIENLEQIPNSNPLWGYVFTSSMFNDLGLLEWTHNGRVCAYSTGGFLYESSWENLGLDSTVPPECTESPVAAEHKGNILTADGVAVLQHQRRPYVQFMSLDTYDCGSDEPFMYACPMEYLEPPLGVDPDFPTLSPGCGPSHPDPLGPLCPHIERLGYLIAPDAYSVGAFRQHVENWELRELSNPATSQLLGYTLQPKEVEQ